MGLEPLSLAPGFLEEANSVAGSTAVCCVGIGIGMEQATDLLRLLTVHPVLGLVWDAGWTFSVIGQRRTMYEREKLREHWARSLVLACFAVFSSGSVTGLLLFGRHMGLLLDTQILPLAVVLWWFMFYGPGDALYQYVYRPMAADRYLSGFIGLTENLSWHRSLVRWMLLARETFGSGAPVSTIFLVGGFQVISGFLWAQLERYARGFPLQPPPRGMISLALIVPTIWISLTETHQLHSSIAPRRPLYNQEFGNMVLCAFFIAYSVMSVILKVGWWDPLAPVSQFVSQMLSLERPHHLQEKKKR